MSSLRLLNLILFLQFSISIISPNGSHAHFTHSKEHVAPLFIFGDSLFDVGNNNYINTTSTLAQANFSPYGETFFRYPTGRFSDGRVVPDFIAEYAKLPMLLPYKLLGENQGFTNGVNFASAGAGALAQTNQGIVIDLKTQLTYFKTVEKLLKKQLGDKETRKMLSRAVYLFSIGGNDYTASLGTNSSQIYSQQELVKMVIGNLTTVVKEIYSTGGRNFGFVSMGTLGCLPIARALNPVKTGDCIEEFTVLAKLHNFAFSRDLKRIEKRLKGFKYSNLNLYALASERMENPSKYGFKDGKSACCGSGPYQGLNSCGGKRGLPEYQLCSNPSEHVFFDFSHVTEMAHRQLAKEMWSGTDANIVSPYNLKQLFEQKQDSEDHS